MLFMQLILPGTTDIPRRPKGITGEAILSSRRGTVS